MLPSQPLPIHQNPLPVDFADVISLSEPVGRPTLQLTYCTCPSSSQTRPSLPFAQNTQPNARADVQPDIQPDGQPHAQSDRVSD